jgi:phage terminase Nu1 subunit (DNA packaging protein)
MADTINTTALAKSVRGYSKHLRDLATGRGGESAISSATAERGRLAKAQADYVEMKTAAMRRELVPAADVEAEWSGVLRTVRTAMLAVPSRVAYSGDNWRGSLPSGTRDFPSIISAT